MSPSSFCCVTLGVLLCISGTGGEKITDTTRAMEYLDFQNAEAEKIYYQSSVAEWSFSTNITDFNQQVSVNASVAAADFVKQSGKNASLFDWLNFLNATMRRRFSSLADIGTAAMPDKTKLQRLAEVTSKMESIYSTAEVCLDGKKCLSLDPGLTRLFASSRDYKRLTDAWVGWRDASGKKMKKLYEEFVALSNEAIKANGFPDTGAYWRSWYESATFKEDLERLFQQLQPLYRQLHAYVRKKLKDIYGDAVFPASGHIPAHILGNMWGQTWMNLLDILRPYKNKQSVDVTPQMVKQGYTPLKMFQISDQFFQSLGMIKMPQEFWNKSMIEKPTDGRKVVCHASAWDFYNQKDFRVKMCTDVKMEDLITIHHEMGHIEYYLQYKNQPVVFRGGANPGFHEAIGDVLALSVSTPQHLKKIGLLDAVVEDEESDINFMMSMALDKIAFLPFGYLVDQWRWSVFSGVTSPANYTKKWWDLRCRYQGIYPPTTRTEEDFDPGAKYHIPANTPYIRYFVSFVIQFQFHKALCKAANQTGPLYKCDIYKSRKAGALLSDLLKLGSSKPWPDAMALITGQRRMDASALMDYFEPLTEWLRKENAFERTGWTEACPPNSGPLKISHKVILTVSLAMILIELF